MANLLDKLRETQTQRAQAPVGGQTRRLEQALTQRATGRGFASRGPRASGVAERAALGEQAALADQQQAQAQQAAAGSQIQQAGQEQRFSQQMQQLSADQKEQLNQYNRRVQEVANNLKRKDLARATDKELFDLSMLGQAQALQDAEYMDNLRRDGQRRRLDDQSTFKQELQESIFSEQEGMFDDQQEFQKMMNMDNDEFTREMTKIDIATANELVRNDISAANKRAIYEGLGSIVSGGIGAYAQYATSQPATPASPAAGSSDFGLSEDELYAGEEF